MLGGLVVCCLWLVVGWWVYVNSVGYRPCICMHQVIIALVGLVLSLRGYWLLWVLC